MSDTSSTADHLTGNTPIDPNAAPNKRRRLLLIASAIFIVIGLIWLVQWLLIGRHHLDTDDAYVAGNVIQVTPQTAGTVVAIAADDTDFVKAGQPLVQLDDTDAKVMLAQAEAELAQTVRQVRGLYTSNNSLRAKIDLQQSTLAKAQADLKRRQGLTESGAVSFEELHHSEDAVKAAQADLLGAQEQLSGNLALTDNTAVANHPNVQAAAAKVRAAYLTLQRTVIPAAVDGYIAKRSVQLGQRVAPGAPLMAIVPLQQVWVDANFKESQLARIRIGQPVKLRADSYGSRVDYHGHIVGLAAGTGGAFSLLPAQNATGNWIKVVQRLPVRVQLDPQELQTHPLSIGLSVIAEVDVTDQSGAQLADKNRKQTAYQTNVYDNAAHAADARVQTIIDANSKATQLVKPEADTAIHAHKTLSARAQHGAEHRKPHAVAVVR